MMRKIGTCYRKQMYVCVGKHARHRFLSPSMAQLGPLFSPSKLVGLRFELFQPSPLWAHVRRGWVLSLRVLEVLMNTCYVQVELRHIVCYRAVSDASALHRGAQFCAVAATGSGTGCSAGAGTGAAAGARSASVAACAAAAGVARHVGALSTRAHRLGCTRVRVCGVPVPVDASTSSLRLNVATGQSSWRDGRVQVFTPSSSSQSPPHSRPRCPQP